MWATASQLLWQHGPLVLAIVAGLYFLTWPERPAWTTALAGLALAMAHATRPTGALFLAAGLATVAAEPRPWRGRAREMLLYLAGAAPVLAAVLIYNFTFFGRPLGWYQQLELVPSQVPVALAGLLVSPNRGLLVFTPIALVGIVGLARAFRHPARAPLLAAFGAAACGDLLIHAAYPEWAAGWSFGPRYAMDALPVLAVAAAGELVDLSRRRRALLAIGLAWSIAVQLNGAFCYPASRWNERVGKSNIQKAAWSLRHFALWEDFAAWRRQPYLAARY
jgi:hypothetical protein